MMGELHFQEKKYDEAVREFQRAMFGFGGEQATPETKNWQAKSGYEAGRVAEVQITTAKEAAAKQKLIADAKRFYTFVAEKHASHELAGEAKKRLEALGKLVGHAASLPISDKLAASTATTSWQLVTTTTTWKERGL